MGIPRWTLGPFELTVLDNVPVIVTADDPRLSDRDASAASLTSVSDAAFVDVVQSNVADTNDRQKDEILNNLTTPILLLSDEMFQL